MDHSLSTVNANGSSVFTLHILNLPLELEQDGVESIFSEYGQVIGIKILKSKNDTNQAFIAYSKYSEAEAAINELHQKLPLMLNIQFKDKSLRMLHPEVVLNMSNPIVDFRYKSSFLDKSHGIKKVIDVGKANCSPPFESKRYTPDDDLLYPVPTHPSIYNPYESAGPYKDTNLMYTRGIAHVSEDGTRHISYGRGYTYYNLPEPHYNIAKCIQSVCEKREKGSYEYAMDTEDEMGICEICSTPTAFKCQKCLTAFYCNKICQVNDWKKHKVDCQEIPPLVKKLKSPLGNGKIKDSLIKKTDDYRPLRPPKTSMQHKTQEQNICDTIENCNKTKVSSSESISDEKPSSETVPSSLEINKNSRKNNFKATGSSLPKTNNKPLQESINDNSVSKSDSLRNSLCRKEQKSSNDNIEFQKKIDFIPTDKFIEVMITSFISDNQFWVQKVADASAITNLCKELEDYAWKTKPIPLEENVKCIIKRQGEWFRATILSLGAKESKVFSYDFGTVEMTEIEDARPINGFLNLPPYCRRIRVTQGFKCNQNVESLFVKALSLEEDGTIIVETKDYNKSTNNTFDIVTEQMSKCSTENEISVNKLDRKTESDIALLKLANMPSVCETLKLGQSGIVLVLGQLNEYEFSMSLVPDNQIDNFALLLDKLKVDCETQLDQYPNYSPNIGDFVCGCNESEWFRGIVLTKVPVIELAIVDESRIIVPSKCTPLPNKYSQILTMGLVCNFSTKTKLPVPMFESAKFTVDEIKSPNEIVITVISDDNMNFTTKALVKKWIPEPEQKGIHYAKLSSGQQVVITHFSAPNILYANNMEKTERERLYRLEQQIAECALNRKQLTKTPVIGEMVLAYYSLDENYYRAIITKVEGQKVLIRYVDYGNEEPSTVDKLYQLPVTIKEQPSCLVKIKLKDIKPDVPLTTQAKNYIQNLILNSVPLTCTFSDDALEIGVTLKTPKNEIVNKDLQSLLTPTWEKLDMNKVTDKKVYQLFDLPNIKLGEVDDEITAIMLFYYPENGSLILGPNDYVLIQAVQEEMTNRIYEYVKTTTSHYIPRDNELCIAKYQNFYYRGLCLDSSATPTDSRIFFIDFGNTECVKHTDIRLFVEDFANFGPLAILCSITPMIPEEKFSDAVSKRISELVPINQLITVKIISIDDLSPSIDIPKIRMQLQDEGLI